MPTIVKSSFLVLSCALVFSGLALAGAAYVRDPELFVMSLAFFLAVAAGAPMLVARQIRRLVEEPEEDTDEPADDFSVFEDVTIGKAEEPTGFPTQEETFPPEDDEDVRRIQKAQAIDRLRDGITHDLNNKLMVISANIDAVARQMKEQPAVQRKLLSALVASDQAAKLIAKSAAFARQSEPQVQYMDLAERVNSVATLMSRSLLRDTVELRLSLDENLWPVEADPDDIETAIVTLSAHVRDALTQGGTIFLEAQNVQVEKGTLSNLAIEGEFVQLSIRSIASAMVPEREEDFKDTFTLEDIDISSWLRLNQSLHFLQKLGGASKVCRSGVETAIILYLPRARATTLLPFGSQGEDEALSESAAENAEILIVDDEIEVALAFQSTLEEFGYVTSIATDAAQAMKNLKDRKPGLVLTDVAMPGTMNGVMLAREVRQIFPDLPVLLITGNPIVADEAGEFPLLHKPIISRDLHAAIQRHLVPQDSDKVVPLFPRTAHRRA